MRTPRYLLGQTYRTIRDNPKPKKTAVLAKPKRKETGCITERHQAYRRSVLCHGGLWVDTYYYTNETEAVQAGAVFEMYNYSMANEKAASGRRRSLDFVHPEFGKLFAAVVFDY